MSSRNSNTRNAGLGLDMLVKIGSYLGSRNRASMAMTSRLGRTAAKYSRQNALERTRKQMQRDLARTKLKFETQARYFVAQFVAQLVSHRPIAHPHAFECVKNVCVEFEVVDSGILDIVVSLKSDHSTPVYLLPNVWWYTFYSTQPGRVIMATKESGTDPSARFVAALIRTAVLNAFARYGITVDPVD